MDDVAVTKHVLLAFAGDKDENDDDGDGDDDDDDDDDDKDNADLSTWRRSRCRSASSRPPHRWCEPPHCS